VHDVYNKNII